MSLFQLTQPVSGSIWPSHRVRGGFTLIEILVTLGVVTLGLFGVLTTIAIATQFADSGLGNERRAELAKQAYRNFEIRQMDAPEHWLYFNGTDWVPPALTNDFLGGNINSPLYIPIDPADPHTNLNPSLLDSRQPIVLDPWLIGQVDYHFGPDASNPQVGEHTKFSEFPVANQYFYANNSLPAIRRITLRQNTDRITGTTTTIRPMSRYQAEAVFTLRSLLEAQPAPDRESQPTQIFDAINDGTNDFLLRRRFDDRYSWFATLVPQTPARFGTALMPSENDEHENYKLSIVVVDEREFYIGKGTNYETVPTEGTVTVVRANFLDQGFSGGALRLEVPYGTNRAEVKKMLDELYKTGTWVFLRGSDENIGSPLSFQYQWYKIVATEGLDEGGDHLAKTITLEGPDFNTDFADMQITAIKGAEDVFEKTIRLNSSSSWAK
ncbi:MAG: type II secretion system GspH family protein [Pirellulaceae bacterium]|nr:type II secretion system GspH family protein [Pirellulaceae bacterium]